MAGYRADISIDNIDSLKKVLDNKVINKVSLEFSFQKIHNMNLMHTINWY